MATCRFSTDRYVAAHGKEPRGRGLWRFTAWLRTTAVDYVFDGTYTEAKREVNRRVWKVTAPGTGTVLVQVKP